MRTLDHPTLPKKKTLSTRTVVEEAIDLSKTNPRRSWGELLPQSDVNAIYPSEVCLEGSTEDCPSE
jgi:hypothetical protein